MNVLCVASLVLSALSAGVAISCYFASRAVTRRHSMISLRAELDEIHDAFAKHGALLKRINARTVMAERRASASGQLDLDDAAATADRDTWKARMRAKLLVPGRPVKHQ
jgi:hypothetical protein